MKLVAFSDTHGQHQNIIIPECDVLVFAGDYSKFSGYKSTITFLNWFSTQLGKTKILIPGNHDYNIESTPIPSNINLLINESLVVDGVKFYGTPYTPEFCGWNYMCEEEDLQDIYNTIPGNIDVLITHGPPITILDTFKDRRIGSSTLLKRVNQVKPKVHIFGHNHCKGHYSNGVTDFYNVSILDHKYYKAYNITELGLRSIWSKY